MVKQARAERTRRALIDSAAAEFGRHGYAGTSLAAVHRACGMTMGALTFHFPTKADLAAAVARSAEVMTHRALARPPVDHRLPPLAAVTLAITRLLEEPLVRATARLDQEQVVSPAWRGACRAALRAAADGSHGLPAHGLSREWEALAVYLSAGAESALRSGDSGPEVREQLHRLWGLVLAAPALPQAAHRGAVAAPAVPCERGCFPADPGSSGNAVT